MLYFVFCFSTTIDMSAMVCASLHLARRVPRKCELPDLRCKWPQPSLAPDARGSKCNPTARILSALRSNPSSERHSKTCSVLMFPKGKDSDLPSFRTNSSFRILRMCGPGVGVASQWLTDLTTMYTKYTCMTSGDLRSILAHTSGGSSKFLQVKWLK